MSEAPSLIYAGSWLYGKVRTSFHAGTNAVIPVFGRTKYIRADLMPDQNEIYRAIKKSGARKHGDIAKVIADMLKIEPHSEEPET